MKLSCRIGWHEWKPEKDTIKVFDGFGRSDLPVYLKQLFRCEHCGRRVMRKI